MKQEIEKEAREYAESYYPNEQYNNFMACLSAGFISGVNSKCAERIKIEFADMECVSFAEWISNNFKWQKKTKRDLWLNNETLKVVTTSELLTIYKKENGK